MKLLIDYAMQFVGLPYKWGGDDTIKGFDCSGFAQEILAAVGMDPQGDQTADRLYRYFKEQGDRGVRRPGALSFYGKPERITHIGFCVTRDLMLEAGGGGSKTVDAEAAARHNAYIRMRPIKARSDFVECIMPRYHLID